MSKSSKSSLRGDSRLIEIKSKFDAEFRRFSVDRSKLGKFSEFNDTLAKLHQLQTIPFVITYTDTHGDLLPINNDDNFTLALSTANPVLKILVQKKGESYAEINGYGPVKKRGTVGRPKLAISLPEDFRRVSAIIDVDVVPETHRRVKLMKNGSDKPLGFYIRDGTSVRVTAHGLEKVPGIFISRLVPGGLAESTGLLAVNDEVLEVNGIEVCGKTLDQVTDMMVANSSNLIITVKPVNQRLTLAPQRGGVGRYSGMSQGSSASGRSGHSRQSSNASKSLDSDLIAEEDDEDEVKSYLNKSEKSNKSIVSEQSDRSRISERSNRSEASGKSGKSSPSSGKNSPASSVRHDKSNQSNRSNSSTTGSKRAESGPGEGKGEKDGPVITL